MVGERLKIDFDDLGLGTVLERFQLVVPRNQRSYAWEESHVQTLFEDLSTARQGDDPTYFLGTIVLTHGSEADEFEVADGQQRLATTAILIGAIRDYLHDIGNGAQRAAREYTSDLLLKYDPRTEENLPKVRLNSVDADFFSHFILPSPDDPNRDFDREPTASSHERLLDASNLAKAHVKKIVAQYPRDQHARILYDWVDFLKRDAIVIVIEVPDHIDAFRMFETLNDRGLRASQIDILKNYIFGISGNRVAEAEEHWISMVGVIESVGDDDLILNCVRHSWIAKNGPTTEALLAESVKEKIKGRQQAIDFVAELDSVATDYTALLNPLNHPRWAEYDLATKSYLAVITTILDITQIRPLLLAVVRHFSPEEVKEAFRLFVSWSARFLVAGGGGGGVLDRHYGLMAKEVSDGALRTAGEIANRMAGIVRSNEVFQAAFRNHSVSKKKLARYYLRTLELQLTGDDTPSLGGVDDTTEFNLEHIIPQRPSDDWDIDSVAAQNYHKRIGNMVLLSPSENVNLGNRPFAERIDGYRSSPLLLTQDVATATEWGPVEVEERQEKLAELAVEAWRL